MIPEMKDYKAPEMDILTFGQESVLCMSVDTEEFIEGGAVDWS